MSLFSSQTRRQLTNFVCVCSLAALATVARVYAVMLQQYAVPYIQYMIKVSCTVKFRKKKCCAGKIDKLSNVRPDEKKAKMLENYGAGK